MKEYNPDIQKTYYKQTIDAFDEKIKHFQKSIGFSDEKELKGVSKILKYIGIKPIRQSIDEEKIPEFIIDIAHTEINRHKRLKEGFETGRHKIIPIK